MYFEAFFLCPTNTPLWIKLSFTHLTHQSGETGSAEVDQAELQAEDPTHSSRLITRHLHVCCVLDGYISALL